MNEKQNTTSKETTEKREREGFNIKIKTVIIGISIALLIGFTAGFLTRGAFIKRIDISLPDESGVDGAIDSMGDTISNISDGISGTTGISDNLTNSGTEIESTVSGLGSDLTNIEGTTSNLGESIDRGIEQANGITESSRDITNTTDRIESVYDVTNGGISNTINSIREIKERLGDLSGGSEEGQD